jgi:hypothetical protein
MPMWRCPHCATPQAETARCWVCHRSSTACGACRHFRRSVAGQLGYCGLDRQRRPLTGDEIRACWEAADAKDAGVPALPGVAPVWPLPPDLDRTTVRAIEFVEVTGSGDPPVEAAPHPGHDATTFAPHSLEPRWSLFGELEA